MYDDPGGDDYHGMEYTESEGTGLLGATLRVAGVTIALGLGIAWMSGGLGSGEAVPLIADGSPPAARTGGQIEGEIEEPEAVPDQRVAYALDQIVIPAGPRGHFLALLDVNGTSVRFLVDTGATMVTLTAEDAQRIGLPIHALDYSTRAHTANGEVGVAAVTLRDIQLGGLEFQDVAATVTQADLNISLLGMSFLNRLSSFEVRPEGLILRY